VVVVAMVLSADVMTECSGTDKLVLGLELTVTPQLAVLEQVASVGEKADEVLPIEDKCCC
jgi:hypothetical protein